MFVQAVIQGVELMRISSLSRVLQMPSITANTNGCAVLKCREVLNLKCKVKRKSAVHILKVFLMSVSGLVFLSACDPSNVHDGKWSPEDKKLVANCLVQLKEALLPIIAQGGDQDPEKNASGHVNESKKQLYSAYLDLVVKKYALEKDITERSPWEERMKFEHYFKECKEHRLVTDKNEKHENAAELREKALAEWDSAIKSDMDKRTRNLKRLAVSVKTVNTQGARYDSYKLKDGRVISCSTKVSDTGTFMNCDGNP